MQKEQNNERILARRLARELTSEEMASLGGQAATYWETYITPGGDWTLTPDAN